MYNVIPLQCAALHVEDIIAVHNHNHDKHFAIQD